MQSLSAPRESGTDAGAVPPVFGPVSRQIFTDRYNQANFLFRHELDHHPLFKLPSLLELARRRPADSRHAYWSNGRVDVGHRWDAKVAPRRSLEDTVEHIADNDSLAMLKHLETDAVFGPVIREICATVVELAGARMRRDVLEGRGTILIASPGRLTSYHIDSDTNYLFQIAGDKSLSVFDQLDRSLTTHEELDALRRRPEWCGLQGGAPARGTCLRAVARLGRAHPEHGRPLGLQPRAALGGAQHQLRPALGGAPGAHLSLQLQAAPPRLQTPAARLLGAVRRAEARGAARPRGRATAHSPRRAERYESEHLNESARGLDRYGLRTDP